MAPRHASARARPRTHSVLAHVRPEPGRRWSGRADARVHHACERRDARADAETRRRGDANTCLWLSGSRQATYQVTRYRAGEHAARWVTTLPGTSRCVGRAARGDRTVDTVLASCCTSVCAFEDRVEHSAVERHAAAARARARLVPSARSAGHLVGVWCIFCFLLFSVTHPRPPHCCPPLARYRPRVFIREPLSAPLLTSFPHEQNCTPPIASR